MSTAPDASSAGEAGRDPARAADACLDSTDAPAAVADDAVATASASAATPPRAPAAVASTSAGRAVAWRALRSRNYRLFFLGQGTSLIGTWMQSVAMSWLVYRLTGSGALLGQVGFVGQLPVLLVSAVAGVFLDRWNMRRLLILTQSLALAQAALLGVLTLTGVVQIWHIMVLSAFVGIVNAFDMPARQAFVVHMVEDPADLPNAIALNSFLVNGARFVGPALAGLLITAVGEGPCFLINALSYVAVVIALIAMHVPARPPTSKPATMSRGLKEAFVYALGFAPIRDILLLLVVTSLMGMSYATVLPLYAGDVLHGGPHTLGFLFTATGFGAVCGAIYLASRPSVVGLGRVIGFGAALFGVALMATSAVHTEMLALPLMLVAGLGMMLQIASTNTVLQTIADDDKRGRVMGLYVMAFIGMTPFGALLAGHLADALGAPTTILIGGSTCFLGAVLFLLRLPALRPLVWPVYARKGILPADPPAREV